MLPSPVASPRVQSTVPDPRVHDYAPGAGTVDSTLGEATGDVSTVGNLESADIGCVVRGPSGVTGIRVSRGCVTLRWSR